jgi:uncharacterized tellurite resistance protein B-like protein
MKTENEMQKGGLNYKAFYKELGHLLYAVANADGKVQAEEIQAMKKFILEELVLFESRYDSSGMNQAFYAQFEFNDSLNRHMGTNESYTSFIQFMKNNAAHISSNLKKTIFASVESVATAYDYIDKKERELINNLKEEINALPHHD